MEMCIRRKYGQADLRLCRRKECSGSVPCGKAIETRTISLAYESKHPRIGTMIFHMLLTLAFVDRSHCLSQLIKFLGVSENPHHDK